MATFCERFFGCVDLWKEGRGKQVIVQAFEKKGVLFRLLVFFLQTKFDFSTSNFKQSNFILSSNLKKIFTCDFFVQFLEFKNFQFVHFGIINARYFVLITLAWRFILFYKAFQIELRHAAWSF